MRYKTLMALAVAGAVGWSVNTLAGSEYEVSTPSAANETGPVMVPNASNHTGWMSSTETPIVLSESSYSVINNGYADDSAVGATADSGSGSISGSVASDEYASSGDEDALALADEGVYSDFYRVTYTPIALSDVDYYVLNDGWDTYALITPVTVETVTLASNDSYDAGDGAVTQVFDDGSILQVFDDGSMLAIDDSAESMVVVA